MDQRVEENRGRHAHASLEAIRGPLLRYCLQVAGSRWEAEDLLQDTMVRLLMRMAERPEEAYEFRYACRIARNLWIDRCRRLAHAKAAALTDAAGMVNGNGGSLSGGGAAHAEMDVREHLEDLAWRLPPKPFVILLLMDVFDFTAKETAAWLGGTETAVQVALSRARGRLRSLNASERGQGHAGGRSKAMGEAGSDPVPADFFEAVLEAFRGRNPTAIQEAYLSLVFSGGQLQRMGAYGGKLQFSFRDPDGNRLIVSA